MTGYATTKKRRVESATTRATAAKNQIKAKAKPATHAKKAPPDETSDDAALVKTLVLQASRLPTTEKDVLAGISRLTNVDAVDAGTGLTVLLAQIASPSEPVVRALLARGAAPNRPNGESGVEIPLGAANAFRQPVTKMLKVGLGDTPLAVLRRAKRQVDRAAADFGRLKRPASSTDAFYYDGHKKKVDAWIAAYPAVEALLTGSGASSAEGLRAPQPTFKTAIDARVMRLGKKLGADLVALEKQLAAEDASVGPFSTFKQGIVVLRGLVAIEFDATTKRSSLLARILANEAFASEPPRTCGSPTRFERALPLRRRTPSSSASWQSRSRPS